MLKEKKSLAETHPELAKLWLSALNKDLTPFQITKGSNKKIWWKCPKEDDHIWQKAPNQFKYKSSGCPMCSGKFIQRMVSKKEFYHYFCSRLNKIKNESSKSNKTQHTYF